MRTAFIATLGAALLGLGCPTSSTPIEDPTPAPEPDPCGELGLPTRAFQTEGEFGSVRWTLAADFTIEEMSDRSEWTLSENWTGCDSYAFLPDRGTPFLRSPLDPTSLWEDGVLDLLDRSPRNAHYFFYSAASSNTDADPILEAMVERIEEDLDQLDDEDAAWWRPRLHVVRGRIGARDDWVEAVTKTGRPGFTIDRFQRIREIGSLADVERFSSALQAAEQWPWENNMAYVANELRYYDYEARRQEYLDAQDATVVSVEEFSGQLVGGDNVLSTVTFPSATELQAFDTLEVDLTALCPEVDEQETGNCGAWDYLSHIWIRKSDEDDWTELARFITTYHRAARYLVDATPLLAVIAEGGEWQLRYATSPPWNHQQYMTEMDFRFTNQGKGYRPSAATTPLWGGKNFNSEYNDGREPIDVDIPATAQRVEIWALITGHGGNNNNCAEFCNHQHEWTIGDQTYFHEHDTIGNDMACVEAIDNGTVPNQSGTWWFGRGGWCPGQQVDPVIFDVTDQVTPGGTATVSYRGLYNNGAIPDNSGNIVMSSWLVVYE